MIIIIRCWQIFSVFMTRGVPPTNEINDFCVCNPTHFACSEPLPPQFDKFIWFITDSYPLKRFEKALPTYEDHSIIFTVSLSGNRYSHAVYTCWWTGMPPANVFGSEIKGDNLIASINRASKGCSNPNANINEYEKPEFKIRYIGPEWSPIELLGGKDKVMPWFDEMRLITNDDCYPYVYPDVHDPEKLKSLLQDLRSKNQSLIIHSGVFDHASHFSDEETVNFFDDSLIKLFKQDILVNFIHDNPDYLLILSSDHGESSTRFHGEIETLPTKNIGCFMFYHPDFEHQDWTQIMDVDVTPTLTSFFKSVDIPFFSFGVIANSFASRNANEEYRVQLMRNIIQLKKLSEYYEKDIETSFPYPHSNQDELDEFLKSSSVEMLLEVATSYRTILYFPAIPFYLFEFVVLSILIIAILFIFLRLNFKDFLMQIFTIGWLLWPLLSVWWRFKKYFMYTNYIYIATHFGITAILLFFENEKQNIMKIEAIGLVIWFINNNFPLLPSIYQKIGLVGLSFIIYLILNKNEEREEDEHHQQQNNHQQKKEQTIVLVIHVLMISFLLTEDVNTFYFMFGFNIFAFGFYSLLFGVIIYGIIKHDKRIGIDGLCWLMFILQNCNPRAILINIQFKKYITKLGRIPKVAENSEKAKQNKLRLIQILSVYYLDYIIYAETFLGKQTLDLDIDVNPGQVGVLSWNLYPVFSAFLMFIGKTGTLIIAMIYAVIFLRNYVFSMILVLLQICATSLSLVWGIAVFRIGGSSPVLEMFILLVVYSILLISLIVIYFIREIKSQSIRKRNLIEFDQ
ncbi:hypothetical protein M0811_04389 [Anaeramoeba ignava]|uniref:Uncharacterized protein n=1 Tax=Anaeramoeba ignava TaxID=1746090 RepID=A0A9Q0LUN2_ANAIG|nr:hypothetical protein M0811_04389 [Anaeramoeba ignava]